MPNPYPGRFANLLDALPPAAVCLDLGSGDRQRVGVVSFDYARYSGGVQGDCLQLPFRSDSADLILSQATLEHVTNPQLAVDEMLRVLRPGGVLYVEAAFMQPIHMAPHHYFNITPYGLAHLLRDWEVLESGTVGTMKQVMDWIFETVGYGKRFPRWAPNDGLYLKASSGVYATARKPV